MPKKIIGYEVLVKPKYEKVYTDYEGFYFTMKQAKERLESIKSLLLEGDQAKIKTIYEV